MASLRHKLPLTFFETSLKSQTLRAHLHHTCMKTNGKKAQISLAETPVYLSFHACGHQFFCMLTSVFLCDIYVPYSHQC